MSMEVCRTKLSEETNSVDGLEDNIHEVVSLLTTNDTTESLRIAPHFPLWG